MKTFFFILFAILGWNVEGIKIRAVRTRLIQNLPYIQNIHPQSEYFSGLPQNPKGPIYKNGIIYSYMNPGGVRFNMLGDRGSYASYLKNYLNRGKVHQNVHYNWPSSAIHGISSPAYQYGLNSGYNGLIGQSAYQSWQNSASGSPIGISVEQSGINPGHIGHIHTVYQSWQNPADGGGVEASLQQKGVNSGYTGNIDSYQNWQNSASVRPNDASVEPSELSPENIDQSLYQSWQDFDGGRPIDIPIKQSNLYPGHIESTYQSLQSSTPESPVDLYTDQTLLNTGYNGDDHPEDQIWQNSGDEGDFNISVDQIVPNSASGGEIDIAQQNVPNFGQNLANGGQPIFSLDQGGVNEDFIPQYNDIINEINVNTEGNTEPNHSVTDHDLIFSVEGSKLNQPNEAPLENITKDMIINNKENISPIRAVTENYLISPDNEVIISGDQSNLNWAVQEPFKEIQFHNEEGISPVSVVSENDIDFPNNEGMITNHSVTEHDLIFSVDRSKPNQPNEPPLQDIIKDITINNKENISPIGAVTKIFKISSDNAGIISGDQSNLNWVVQETFKDNQFNNEEGISLGSDVTENYIDLPNNEGIITNHSVTEHDHIFSEDASKLNQPNEAPHQNSVKDMIINNKENISPIGAVTENYHFFPDNEDIISGDQSNLIWTVQEPLKENQFNNEEGISPVSAVTENYIDFPNNEDMISVSAADQTPLKDIEKGVHVNNEENVIPSNIISEGDQISPDMANNEENSDTEPVNELISADDVASFVVQSEATGAPLREILEKIKINNAVNSSPVTLIENNPITRQRPLPLYPYIFKPVQQQSPVLRYLHILKPNEQESPVTGYSYILKQNQHQSPGYTTTWNQFTTPSQRHPLNVPYKTPSGNLQWLNTISRNVSPQQGNNVFCLNPNTNVIPERERTHYGVKPGANTREIIEYIKTFVTRDSPQIYKNRETPIIGSTNVDHTNPNFYQEIYPYNKPNNINMNKHNIPQPNYYVPTPSQALQNGFHIQPDILNPHNHPLPQFGIGVNEDEEVITKDPDSSTIYIEPNGIGQTFETRNLLPESGQPMTSEITKLTGYEEPRQLTRTTPKQYVYGLTKAFMPELMRLYHSKCDNGYDEILINEFKKLVDSIQGEHCEIF